MHNRPEKVTGCVVALLCGKLVGTITECHVLKVATAAIEPKECGRIRMDVDPAEVCDGRRAVIEIDDVGSVEPSFNCWQPDTKNGGNMKMEGGMIMIIRILEHRPTRKKWVGSWRHVDKFGRTPNGEVVGEEQGGVNDELITCKSEINRKDARICELEQRVETLEKLLGRHAGNLFADLHSVIVEKDFEIARLSKQVDQLETKISNLEDSLDDLEVHEVTQFVVNDGSNQRTPSNSLSGKVSGSGNVTSGESAQQSACPAGQPEDVGISELEIVENETGIEDLTIDFAHGNVRTTVQGVEGSCNPRNAQTLSGGNVKDGAVVVGVEGRCEHTAAATSSGPKITSLVKRVKNKARQEFRLSDYEYSGIFGRPQVNANVRLGKSFEPGVIYSVEDVEVERKT
ncbi:hypothetical protein ACSBR2_030990 [Camellia fascicularis]